MSPFLNRTKTETQFDKPYIYVTVCFQMSSTPYLYRTTDKTIKVGDCVIVPAKGKDTTALVVDVNRYSVTNVPYPVEKTKLVKRIADFEERYYFEHYNLNDHSSSYYDDKDGFEELLPNVEAGWTEHEHLFSPKAYECSHCGKSLASPSARCPGCGAVMKKTKYDPCWVDEIELMDALFH